MSIKQNNLLEINDSYLYVDWLSAETDTQMIAIYRDVEKDGSWVLEQFRGPWSKIVSGYLMTALSRNDGTYQLYNEVKAAAMDVFMALNEEGLAKVKGDWGGKVYDH
jgi:hypothetical protein